MSLIRKRTTILLGTALVAGILLTACGAGGSDTTSSVGGARGAAEPAAPAQDDAKPEAQAQAQAPAQAQAQAKDQPALAPNLSVDQRSIIYRGTIAVRVNNVNAAAAQVSGIATTAGGFVGSDNRTSGTGSDTATMELRVPAEKFSAVVGQLSKLGTEEQRQLSTEDVTEETVDLDARITVQQARVDSGRRLLAQAKSLSDLVMLEREVATRESDLASLQAKKRRLADLTALSTITVTLLHPQAVAARDPDDNPGGFLGGLTAGWHALLASLVVLLTLLGALLPWLIALGLPIWGVLIAVRRFRRARRPALAVAAEQPAGGPPGDTAQGTD